VSDPVKKVKFDIGALLHEESKVEHLEIKSPEDPDDKALRLRKEFWSYLVKDLAAYLISYVFLLLIGLYCLYVVARYGVASSEAKLVLPLITTLFGGVVGMIVGRASK
jgi:hypothetical protein